jgi:hypothetical protein
MLIAQGKFPGTFERFHTSHSIYIPLLPRGEAKIRGPSTPLGMTQKKTKKENRFAEILRLQQLPLRMTEMEGRPRRRPTLCAISSNRDEVPHLLFS